MPTVEPEIAVRAQPMEPPEHLPAPEMLSEKPEVVAATQAAPQRAAEPEPDEELESEAARRAPVPDLPSPPTRFEEPKKAVSEIPPAGIKWRGPRVSSGALRTLAGIVAGGLFILLLCVTGVSVGRLLGDVSRGGSPSLELSSLLPAALLLLSVLSFGGAVALIGAFLWLRRSVS